VPPDEHLPVEVRRSTRRRKTVSAYRQDGRIVVLIPARCSAAEERRWVETMVARLTSSTGRRPRRTDADLQTRAGVLSRRYLDGRAVPTSVSWSQRQGRRWGSCTPDTGEIRLSARLRKMPDWVVDYVLVHELAHLLEADHSAAFWSLVERYPRTERARGFLEGASYGEDEPDTYEHGSSSLPELD
jgi:predicted metal-dependent hydrolase